MSTLTSTLNDLEMNLDAIEDMMESMAMLLGGESLRRRYSDGAADTASLTAVERKIFVNDQD